MKSNISHIYVGKRRYENALYVALVAPVEQSGYAGGQARAGFLLKKYLLQRDEIYFQSIKIPNRFYQILGKGFISWFFSRISFYVEFIGILTHRSHPGIFHFFSPCTLKGLAEKSLLAFIARMSGALTLLNLRNDPQVFINSLSPSVRQIAKRFITSFSYVICQSDSLKKYMISNIGLCHDRVFIIYNGIELKDIKITDHEIYDRYTKFRLIYVGRICHRKGLDVLVDAVSMFYKNHGKLFEVDIIGPIQELTYYKNLINRANALKVIDKLNFKGPIFGKEKDVILRQAALLVLPSRTEGFPNVLLEAMQFGIPAVVSDVGGTKDIAKISKVGISVVKPDNPAGICNQIAKLNNRETYLNASRGVQEAVKVFDIRIQTKRLCEIYKYISNNRQK